MEIFSAQKSVKIELNPYNSALFDMKTRVCPKHLVNDCRKHRLKGPLTTNELLK